MSFVHGKGSAVLLDEFDLSSDFSQYNWGFSIQTPNITTFGNDDKVFIGGLSEGQVRAQGVWNADQSDEELVDVDGSLAVISLSPQGFAAIGDRAHMARGRLENYQPRSAVNDAVRFSTGFKASAGAYLGVCLHHNNQEDSTGNFDSVDGAAQTTDGATAFLHVVEFDGTDATITIEDSSDDETFGSLAAFPQVTGVGSAVLRPSDTGTTVERYTRVALAGTFTTITFVVTLKRHRK